MEMLVRVLRKEIPLQTHAHQADDIVTKRCVLPKNSIWTLWIEHCTEGHQIVDFLAAWKYSCHCRSDLTSRSKVKLKDKTYATLEYCTGSE